MGPWSIFTAINKMGGGPGTFQPNEVLLSCCNPQDPEPLNTTSGVSINNPQEKPFADGSVTWPKLTTSDAKADAKGVSHNVSSVYRALIYKEKTDQAFATKIADKIY